MSISIEPMNMLVRWVSALQRVGDYLTVSDSPEAVEEFGVLARTAGERDLASEMEWRGPAPLIGEISAERREALIGAIGPMLTAGHSLVFRNDAIRLEKSIGETRPVRLAAFGYQDFYRPESILALNYDFPHGYGRALVTSPKRGDDPLGSHRFYSVPNGTASPYPLENSSLVSMQDPVLIGRLIVGGLLASDLRGDSFARIRTVDPVDILLIGGEVLDGDWVPLEAIAHRCQASLVVAEATNRYVGSFLECRRFRGVMTLSLGAARSSYASVEFDPRDATLSVQIKEMSTGVSRGRPEVIKLQRLKTFVSGR